MAKKKPHAEGHSNAERWMVSYADFLTLLFAVFVVLYSFAMTQKSEASAMIQGLIDSFVKTGIIESRKQYSDGAELISTPTYSPVQGASMIVNPNALKSPAAGGGGYMDFGRPKSDTTSGEQVSPTDDPREGTEVENSVANSLGENQMGAPLDSVREDIGKSLEALDEAGLVLITQNKDWLSIELSDALMFAPYSASILNRAIPIIQKIAETLKPLSNYVRIRGYTDNTVVDDEVYRSNWELSAARSISVIKVLVDEGVDPRRLAVEAYGQFAPFVSNSTERGRAQNRRVVISISKYAMRMRKLEIIPDEVSPEENKNVVSEEQLETMEVIRLPDGRLRVYNRDQKPETKE